MIKYKYEYTNTNTNTQIHKYKYKYRGVSEVKFWTLARKKKFSRKRPYLWNRSTYIAQTPLKTKLFACATWKTHQGVSNMPWEHRRAWRASFRGSLTHRVRLTLGPEARQRLRQKSELFCSFWPNSTILWTRAIKKLPRDTLGKSLGPSVAEWRVGPLENPLSYHARPALISGMDFHQKWPKQKVVMIKYKYKYTNTNTNTQIRIQIRTYKYKYKYRKGSGVKFWHSSEK